MTCKHCGRGLLKAKNLCTTCYERYRRKGYVYRTIHDPNNVWIHEDGYVVIDIYNQKAEKIAEAFADTEDLDLVKEHKWCLNKNNFVITKINHKVFKLHEILFPKLGKLVHINGNKLDNRESNLKQFKTEVPQSNYTGAHWDDVHQRWKASIQVNKKKYHLGTFYSKEDAIEARKKAEKELRGNYGHRS